MSTNHEGLSILHLEDSSLDAALISARLKALKGSYSVKWVVTRPEFVQALAEGRIDIVLSDYRLPGFDGDEALRLVRQKHDHLPFIMLTGELGEDRAIETIKRGATDYVLKSNLARLVPSIERAIREAKAEQERRRTEAELREVKDRLAHELSDMRRLHDLCIRLMSDRNPEQMLQRVLKACMELLGADKGNVQTYDGATRTLLLKEQRGFSKEFVDSFRTVTAGQDTPCGIAAERAERVASEDLLSDERFSRLRDVCLKEDVRSGVSTPLIGYERRIVGMLTVYFSRPHAFGRHELDLLDLYTQQAAQVIEFTRETAYGAEEVLDLYVQPPLRTPPPGLDGRGSA